MGLKPGQRHEEVGGADIYFRPFVMATELKSSPEVRAMALDAIQKMIGGLHFKTLPLNAQNAHPPLFFLTPIFPRPPAPHSPSSMQQ